MLAPHLRAAGSASPRQRERHQAAAHRQARQELRERLGAGWRHAALDRILFLTRRYLLLRENQRFWFDKLLLAVKRSCLWLGEALAQQGALEQPRDVRFLTWPELQSVVDGSLPPAQAAEWVRARGEAWHKDCAAPEPPVFLRGDDEVVEEDRSGRRLQGLGVSGGRARGRVRIVRSLSESNRLSPGEILVTRATDPSWTPLFLRAAGVVLEMGSRLSHGAVVAREYQVPAVVNISGVMRQLSEGQEVTVDGTRGIVWLHPDLG